MTSRARSTGPVALVLERSLDGRDESRVAACSSLGHASVTRRSIQRRRRKRLTIATSRGRDVRVERI